MTRIAFTRENVQSALALSQWPHRLVATGPPEALLHTIWSPGSTRMTHRTPSAGPNGHGQRPGFTRTALLAGGATLALAWLGAWQLQLNRTVMLAVTLFIVLVTLSAIGLKLAVNASARHRGSDRASATAAPAPAAHGPAAVQDLGTPLQGKRWSLDVFAAIDAQRFAAVCETWFSWAGFDTRYEAHRTSEGVDIWLHAARMPGPVAIVRCKHPQDKPVELRDMQEFLGVVSRNKTAHGTFTTTSTYTPEALQFAREHGIDAVDGRALLRRILTRTRQSQQALLAVAFNGR